MSDHHEVEVALATYNGARFLPEFLQTVEAQTWPRVAIVASDDDSSDDTRGILTRSSLTKGVHRNPAAGIVTNFNNALANTSAPYVALADQDDTWRADKLETMMGAMRAAEEHATGPVLVFSDLGLVDEALRPLHASFFSATDKDSRARLLADFVLGNHIPGCAMLANRALVELALPIPPQVRMHDWWIALVAAGLGQIVYVDQPLIQYRQHGDNSMGAPIRQSALSKRLRGIGVRLAGYRNAAQEARAIVSAFQARYNDQLTTGDREMLSVILGGGMLARLRALKRARAGSGYVQRTALKLLYRR